MSSILPEYQYDIFISYRQKDNEYDGWVTEFVDNLKHELSATFKENISIYFDENTDNGLLESHDVDQSLNEKIKALIFIPIVSQTYCDPNCFAWQKELLAFRDFAKDDQHGLDIKLTNGNVAKRILPVTIHEIEDIDKQLFEKEVGGVMRAIDFIYEEPGVNRPLKPDDSKEDNLLKIRYRNQVNKAANAIKELIYALQHKPLTSSRSHTIKPEIHHSLVDDKSIVVLPFVNMSKDPSQEYFSDGLTEEIITDLSQIDDLSVISRSSAMTFKESNKNIQQIAKELNVTHVLEGSARIAGNKLRITAQLIHAETDSHLWAEKYDSVLEDIFDIQEEVSLQIVNTLKIKLLDGEEELKAKRYTKDFETYNLYLQGRYFRNNITESGLRKGISYYQQAIEKEPTYALAYAGIADCYALLGWYYYLSSNEAFAKAKAAVQKALEIDENLSEAHTVLGLVKMVYDRDWTAAEKEFKRALELNPNDANTYFFYSMYLAAKGLHDESITVAKRGQQLEPLIHLMTINLAMRFYYARNYDVSIEQILSILEMDPNFISAHFYIAWPYMQKGMLSEALKNLDKAAEALGKTAPILISCRGIVYSLMGRKNEANKVLDELYELSKQKRISSYYIAEIYAKLDQKNQAFEWLEKAYEERDPQLIWCKVDPLLDGIRADPKFIALLKKMGLSTNEPGTNSLSTKMFEV